MVSLVDKWIVVEGNSVTQEEIDNVKKQIEQLPENKKSKMRIIVSRSAALSGKEIYEVLSSNFSGVDLFIKVDDVEYDPNFNASQVFSREEMIKLFEGNAILERNGSKLFLSAYNYGDDPYKRENKIPFSKVIQSNARMNNWVDKINKARINGKPLSPFEKYLYAYQIVTQFKYTEDQIFEARDISRILSSKFIVCAGYSSLLSELCRRVGIICKRQSIHVHDTGNEILDAPNVVNHEECLLYLKDSKYGIDGFFITDPTNDSFDISIEEGTSLTYALIALDEHDRLYKNGEEIMKNEFNDFSNYFFLRDAKVIPDKKLFFESDNYISEITDAVKNGIFDKDFANFIKTILNDMTVPKRINNFVSYQGEKFRDIFIGDNIYSPKQIAESINLLTNVAYSVYSLSNIKEQSNYVVMKDFFEKAVAIHIQNCGIEKTPNWIEKLANKFVEISKKTNAVTGDPQLLSSLADFYDYNIVSNSRSNEKFLSILGSHPQKSPTLEDYKKAMKNVYMARGDKKEEASKQANELISMSVWLADANGWGDAGTNNPFAVEAERTKPVQKLQEKQIEEILPYLSEIGITEEYLRQVIQDKNEEEFENILDKLESIIAEISKNKEKSQSYQKIDNRTIKAWNVGKKSRYWDKKDMEQISTIESKVFSE